MGERELRGWFVAKARVNISVRGKWMDGVNIGVRGGWGEY